MAIDWDIEVQKSIDIEETIREALAFYIQVYCRPLPESFSMPCVLITHTGGDSIGTASGGSEVDTFVVVLDARASTEEEASDAIRNAVGILEKLSRTQNSGFGHVEVNSLYSWGADPVRPDIAMCSATLTVTAHRETETITSIWEV